MFKKLLKYDMQAVLRLWWIGAIVTPIAAVIGGIMAQLLKYANDPDTQKNIVTALITMMAGVSIFICVLTIILSFVLTVVLVYVRFYKNLYTDEGYLTFTLPVTRKQILLSKTVNALIWYNLHFILVIASLILFSMIAPSGDDGIINFEFFRLVSELFGMIWKEIGAWTILYAAELLLIIPVSFALSICTVHLSITIGSIIAKKAKIIVSILVYYLINSAISLLMQLGLYSVAFAFAGGLSTILPDSSANQAALFVALIIFIAILVVSAICVILYCITQSLLDRKLNLS